MADALRGLLHISGGTKPAQLGRELPAGDAARNLVPVGSIALYVLLCYLILDRGGCDNYGKWGTPLPIY